MLILTRKSGETLRIGDDVTITVLSVKGNQVRIGIGAPKEIEVHREEIYNRIKAEEQDDIELVKIVDDRKDQEETPVNISDL